MLFISAPTSAARLRNSARWVAVTRPHLHSPTSNGRDGPTVGTVDLPGSGGAVLPDPRQSAAASSCLSTILGFLRRGSWSAAWAAARRAMGTR